MFSSLAGDIDHMPAELGLYDGDVPGVVRECRILEGLDHLTASEPSEVSALPSGGAFGPLSSELCEVRTAHDLIVEVVGLLLCVHKDV